MAKTFKSVSSVYTIEGNYITRENGKLALKPFNILSDSKSERVIKSRLAKKFVCRVADIDIDSITAETVTTFYKIHATLAEIIGACENAGINIDIVTDDDTADDENDETETA